MSEIGKPSIWQISVAKTLFADVGFLMIPGFIFMILGWIGTNFNNFGGPGEAPADLAPCLGGDVAVVESRF